MTGEYINCLRCHCPPNVDPQTVPQRLFEQALEAPTSSPTITGQTETDSTSSPSTEAPTEMESSPSPTTTAPTEMVSEPSPSTESSTELESTQDPDFYQPKKQAPSHQQNPNN